MMISDTHEEINQALADCYKRTGAKASKIYLGKHQMRRLMTWAVDNQYITTDAKHKRDGDNRPEVSGLPIYEVNDDDHCEVI